MTRDSAVAKARLDAANYSHHVPQHGPRCETCAHVSAAQGLLGVTKHARHCGLHGAKVKTHGTCAKRVPA